jgi:hypothetical protein
MATRSVWESGKPSRGWKTISPLPLNRHMILCFQFHAGDVRQYNRRKSGASLETLGLEDRTIEGGVAENHKAFAYGLATLKPVLVCHICQWSIRPKRALSITGLRSHGT